METTLDDDCPAFVREATVTCAASRWFGWLLDQPEWQGKIKGLAQAGAKDHRNGLAFREAPAGDLIPDAARFERWQGAQRALAFLLPSSLRGMIGWLALWPSLGVLTERPPLRPPHGWVLLVPGPPISTARVERAQSTALRRLRGERGPSDARRSDDEAFRRFLADIDPGRPPLLFIEAQTADHRWVKSGSLINTSATGAAHGQFPPCPSQVGYPPLGRVATQAHAVAGVEPPRPPYFESSFVFHRNGP
jgi:hypothetical protein